MTVLFCDVKGFTGISEGMTPQGLVRHHVFTRRGAAVRRRAARRQARGRVKPSRN
jgi:hypothetical protein